MASVFRMTITTHRLVVLLLQLLFRNCFLLMPANPASAGWTDHLYLRVALLDGSLLVTTLVAATILLSVRPMAKGDKVSTTGWSKARALLLVAISLSAASTYLAVATFEFGFRYRRGRASVFFGLPPWVLMLFILGIEHGLHAGLLLAESQA